jgi:hypothetical protein
MLLTAHIIAPEYSLFDNGALHAVATLQLAVPLLALGIALGRLGWRAAASCGALALFGVLAVTFEWPQTALRLANVSTPLSFLAAGLALIAGGTRFADRLAQIAALVVGLHAGLMGRTEDASGMFALGAAVGGAELLIFPALLSARFWRPWLTIPTRIAASWLLAVGLMFLGLALRPLPQGSTIAPETPAQIAACPNGHRHGVNGEFICLPPTADAVKAATPNITKYDNAPPEVGTSAPKGGVQ